MWGRRMMKRRRVSGGKSVYGERGVERAEKREKGMEKVGEKRRCRSSGGKRVSIGLRGYLSMTGKSARPMMLVLYELVGVLTSSAPKIEVAPSIPLVAPSH